MKKNRSSIYNSRNRTCYDWYIDSYWS